jgi:phenylacetic acid degradation operon negative regulatory protein
MKLRSRSTKAIVLELLSAAPGGVVSVRGLVRASAIFGISGNSLRVTLARLKQQRLVETARRGEYRLGSEARSVQREVAAWRQRDKQLRVWKGAWIGVFTGALSRSDRRAARKRGRALRFLGFRQLGEGMSLRPDNLRGSVQETRQRLNAMGLEPEAPVFRLSCLDHDTESRAIALWDPPALDAAYQRMYRSLRDASDSFSRQPLHEAAALAFVLGGDAIRHIVLDPLLPSPIVDADARARFFDAMRDFDTCGRKLWRALMEESHQAVHV